MKRIILEYVWDYIKYYIQIVFVMIMFCIPMLGLMILGMMYGFGGMPRKPLSWRKRKEFFKNVKSKRYGKENSRENSVCGR